MTFFYKNGPFLGPFKFILVLFKQFFTIKIVVLTGIRTQIFGAEGKKQCDHHNSHLSLCRKVHL